MNDQTKWAIHDGINSALEALRPTYVSGAENAAVGWLDTAIKNLQRARDLQVMAARREKADTLDNLAATGGPNNG